MDGYLSNSHPESDERQQLVSVSSGRPVSPWQDPRRALAPATRDDFRRELTACLGLVAPSGMNQDDRDEWLRLAWGTLRDMPADLLARGCKVARLEADHPAKVVPAIMREVEAAWKARKRANAQPRTAAPALDKPDYCSPEDAAKILREFGLSSSLRA